MARYRCADCGYVYDEAKEGVAWRDLPDDWVCPACGASKETFALVDTPTSGASRFFPPSVVQAHRIFGYVFLAIYLLLLWQMIPRLWSYQIEFPPRTVVHFVLGLAIGAALMLKIVIVRYFRRLDATLVPQLGAGILLASVVLIGVSTPFALKPLFLERAAAAEGLFAPGNLERVRTLLTQAGLDPSTSQRLASPSALRAGRDVLRRQCVECHDLRTVLARPRTPESWLQTVRRMADRTTTFAPLDEPQQQQVSAYLIAISPQIQRSTQQLRDAQAASAQAQEAVEAAAEAEAPEAFDMEAARDLVNTKCAKCHNLSLIDSAAPTSRDEASELVQRMVDEGLTATEQELGQIIEYLTRTYAQEGVR